MINKGVRVGGMAKYHGKTYKVVSFVDNEHTVILKDLANGETVRAHAFEVIAANSVSRNSVVANALAANAKSDILDYVKKAPYAAMVKKDGRVIRYASLVVPFSRADKVYREVERYLAKRVSAGICRFVNNPCSKGVRENYFYLTVEIPELAVTNSVVAENATAINAGRKTVKVELETVSFEKGVRSETRYMSIEEVRDLLKRLCKSGDADSFVSRLERQGASDIAINASDLYATLI